MIGWGRRSRSSSHSYEFWHATRYYRVYRSVDVGGQWTHVLNVSSDTTRNPDNNRLTLAQAGG
jgi:hypothetical protein